MTAGCCSLWRRIYDNLKSSHSALLAVLLVAVTMTLVGWSEAATLWFEDPPSLDDPCTIVVPPTHRGKLLSVHPPVACDVSAGIMWYATYGRIHLHLFYDTDPSDVTRRDFELCLTSASPDRVFVWWDSRNDSWSAIAAPVWHAPAKKTDCCRVSMNGTMDLYLEAPWNYVNYVAFIQWTTTPVDPASDQQSYDQQYSDQQFTAAVDTDNEADTADDSDDDVISRGTDPVT